MKRDKSLRIRETIKTHVINNSKEYIIVLLFFIIGIFLGVLFVNNVQDVQKTEINNYLTNFIEKLKNTQDLNSMDLLQNSVKQNALFALVIWFFGTTVIGIPVVFGAVLYRGFCLGYTVAVCISIMGLFKGLLFVMASLLLQSIIFIPAILALAVSGYKLYKSIVKDKRRENVKLEIVRHTVFSLIMLMVLLISSIIEVFVSTNFLKILANYF